MKTQLGTVELEGYQLNVEFKEISDNEIECKSLENKRGHAKGNIFYTSSKSLVKVFKEKSDREQAIEWWNKLNIHQQNQLYLSYFGCKATDKFPDEIEQMWRKETQRKPTWQEIIDTVGGEDAFCEPTGIKRLQVDFEMLRDTILNNGIRREDFQKAQDNLKLFFELLSKSSTFAHKAHKELNRLNNK